MLAHHRPKPPTNKYSMYEAITKNKTKFLTHAYTAGSHKFEDPITSIVFDALRYVPAQDSFVFFSKLFEDCDPTFIATDVKLYFWEKMTQGSTRWVSSENWSKLGSTVNRSVEPDLIMHFRGGAGQQRYYLIEVKWDSDESHKELHKQWEILREDIKKDTVQVYLVKQGREPSRAEARVVSWERFCARLKRFEHNDKSPQFRIWKERTVTFLQKIARQFHVFSGFSCEKTSLPNWKFRSFDISIVISNLANYKGQLMSNDGKAIQDAVQATINVWNEIIALEREIKHAITSKTQNVMTSIDYGSSSSHLDTDTTSVYVKHMFNYKLYKNRPKKTFFICILITLLDDTEQYPDNNQPTIHISLKDDNELSIEEFAWQDNIEDNQPPDVKLKYDKKMHLWYESEKYAGDAYFAVPLTAIEDRNDIETQLAAPVAALINERLGEKDANVETVFSKANKLLSFELFEKGVRQSKTPNVDDQA